MTRRSNAAPVAAPTIPKIPPTQVLSRLAALQAPPIAQLKEQWRELFGKEPPPWNKAYIQSRLAYRIQELAYGGLKGEYEEAGVKKRAAIVIGPEYGTVGPDLMREEACECRDWADSMAVCGFAFDPQVGDSIMNLGRQVVLKARMSQELRAADAYKVSLRRRPPAFSVRSD